MLSNDYISNLLRFLLILISFNYFFCWNLIYFIIFFELSSLIVIIMALIFGIQVEKINSFYYFFLYNLIRFIPFLLIIIVFIKYFKINLIYSDFFVDFFFILFSLLVFIVKFPLFFLHYWLPKIHVEASTFSSILLARLLLKFGVIGFYRFLIFLKINNRLLMIYIFFLGFLMSLLICLLQSDLKSQIAFSSISHIRVVFYSLIIFRSLIEKFSFFVTIGHAFRRCLRFWFVGEVFYSIQSRLVMEVNSIFLSNFKFCLYLTIVLILIGSFPFSINYYTEYFIIYTLNKSFYFIWFFVWFFFFDFFFIIFLISFIYFGKVYKKLNNVLYVVIWLFIFWSYNVFFFFNSLL